MIKHIYNIIYSKLRDHGLQIKRSPHWEKVEKDFLKNKTCAICKSIKRLNVHHKKPFHLFPELELDENNLVTLCMSQMECHLLIGHGDNFKAYNPNLDNDIKELQKDISQFKAIAGRAKINRKY